MLTWEEVREMSRYGIAFGSHTQNHPHLTEINIEKAREEIIKSKMDIEERLHKPVDFFSYPYGSFNSQIREIVKSAFKGAISNRPGKIGYKSDIYALERINTTGQIFKTLPFKILFWGSLGFYLILKKSFNKSKDLKMKGLRLIGMS